MERGIDADANLALKILERLDPDLRPLKGELDVNFPGGVLVVPGKLESDDWSHFARRQQALAGAAKDKGGNGKRSNGGP